jgi:hypothetical protein
LSALTALKVTAFFSRQICLQSRIFPAGKTRLVNGGIQPKERNCKKLEILNIKLSFKIPPQTSEAFSCFLGGINDVFFGV